MSFSAEEILQEFVEAAAKPASWLRPWLPKENFYNVRHEKIVRRANPRVYRITTCRIEHVTCPLCGETAERREGCSMLFHVGDQRCAGRIGTRSRRHPYAPKILANALPVSGRSPGSYRGVCGSCGAVTEEREGCSRPIHFGPCLVSIA